MSEGGKQRKRKEQGSDGRSRGVSFVSLKRRSLNKLASAVSTCRCGEAPPRQSNSQSKAPELGAYLECERGGEPGVVGVRKRRAQVNRGPWGPSRPTKNDLGFHCPWNGEPRKGFSQRGDYHPSGVRLWRCREPTWEAAGQIQDGSDESGDMWLQLATFCGQSRQHFLAERMWDVRERKESRMIPADSHLTCSSLSDVPGLRSSVFKQWVLQSMEKSHQAQGSCANQYVNIEGFPFPINHSKICILLAAL